MEAKQFKVVSAGVGAGAVIAMGALGVTVGTDVSAAQPEPPPPGPVTTSEITTGETAPPRVNPRDPEESVESEDGELDESGPVTTTPSVATPPVTAEPPEGFELE